MQAAQICEVFHACFLTQYRTRLEGGESEPFYQPAANDADWHFIYFREDFASSALHEIAHWCIAGAKRREMADFGYWYEGDRSACRQREFELLEVGPQALEWVLSEASKTPFRVSCDNFDEAALETARFRQQVWDEVHALLARGLPPRSRLFAEALIAKTGRAAALEASTYKELPR